MKINPEIFALGFGALVLLGVCIAVFAAFRRAFQSRRSGGTWRGGWRAGANSAAGVGVVIGAIGGIIGALSGLIDRKKILGLVESIIKFFTDALELLTGVIAFETLSLFFGGALVGAVVCAVVGAFIGAVIAPFGVLAGSVFNASGKLWGKTRALLKMLFAACMSAWKKSRAKLKAAFSALAKVLRKLRGKIARTFRSLEMAARIAFANAKNKSRAKNAAKNSPGKNSP